MPKARVKRVVLVTGDSSGIGRACCERLTESGRTVYGSSRTEPGKVSWRHLSMDVSDDASVARGMSEVTAQEGRIDAIVHAAGVSLVGPFEDTTIEEARRHFEVNYFGAYRVLQAALPHMRRQGSGRLIVIGSIGGLIGLPFLSQYCASKFALDGLIESLIPELKPHGIDATVVHPGDFKTELGANRLETASTQPGTPYYDACRRAAVVFKKAEDEARTPETLARKIDALLDRRRLPVRVVVGTPIERLGVLAKAGLPPRIFQYVLRKAYTG